MLASLGGCEPQARGHVAANLRVGNVNVHLSLGARTAWHTHPNGQTIYVTEGIGLCQRRGGPIEVIRPGDRVFFAPGEDHRDEESSAGFRALEAGRRGRLKETC